MVYSIYNHYSFLPCNYSVDNRNTFSPKNEEDTNTKIPSSTNPAYSHLNEKQADDTVANLKGSSANDTTIDENGRISISDHSPTSIDETINNNNSETFSPMVSCKAMVISVKDSKEVKEVHKYLTATQCKLSKSL